MNNQYYGNITRFFYDGEYITLMLEGDSNVHILKLQAKHINNSIIKLTNVGDLVNLTYSQYTMLSDKVLESWNNLTLSAILNQQKT